MSVTRSGLAAVRSCTIDAPREKGLLRPLVVQRVYALHPRRFIRHALFVAAVSPAYGPPPAYRSIT